MIIRLHQLSARAPRLQDLSGVARLMNSSKENVLYTRPSLEEELRSVWQADCFQLARDAWTIVTRQGAIVGYADVQRKCEKMEQFFTLALHVHPEYTERGIESLLIRLGEERIRELGWSRETDPQIKIHISVTGSNEYLHEVMLYEGYCLAQQFLCMHIAMEQLAEPSFSATDGLLTLEVALHNEELSVIRNEQQPADVYKTQKYTVYEKMLGGKMRVVEPKIALPCAAG
ncbi:hypothetical protein KDA_07680 [Dictyobacter alpinus]|uniref:N-acetyltransferase domain-containing protein n=1 Tax=Dictyobacter alpinus TaxID=2014873 RepID=A0A402B1Q5_9CHLR|nr:hypothetical protein [Dictyobacter alpinus]GCE25284.1 hypothetical protein KDA_07680 [Dictyobacter alpinus]